MKRYSVNAILLTLLVGGPLPSQLEASTLVQSMFEDFADGDRNNDGFVNAYDTDVNLSGTLNTSPQDDLLNGSRNLTEVTAPQPGATPLSGFRWLSTRYTSTGEPRSTVRIFDDSVGRTDNVGADPMNPSPVTETNAQVLASGYALGVESKGAGGAFVGVFPQPVVLGPTAGDKVVISLDWRFWRLANNPTGAPSAGELRWGLWQDTDSELGQSGPHGSGGASAVWGLEDGDWFSGASSIGTEGDKSLYARIPVGPTSAAANARINWEYNLNGINGTTNDGRIFEGNGASNTPGAGGDTGTVASPPGDGAGGIIGTLGPHRLQLEVLRLADGLVEVATSIDGVEILRDEIKTTDTGFGILSPPADTFHYLAFRNSTGDYDYAIDNVLVQSFRIPEPSALVAALPLLLVAARRRR